MSEARCGNIWVVDDDRSIRWVLERALELAGFQTRSFSRGDTVLQQIETAEPDAIVSDIRMPGADGLELLAAMKQSHPTVPIIIMTAHSDLEVAVRAELSNTCPSPSTSTMPLPPYDAPWPTTVSSKSQRPRPRKAPRRKLLARHLPCRRCFAP